MPPIADAPAADALMRGAMPAAALRADASPSSPVYQMFQRTRRRRCRAFTAPLSLRADAMPAFICHDKRRTADAPPKEAPADFARCLRY